MSDRSPVRVGLGTVQFGLDYGVTNTTGRVAEMDARAILAAASAAGIDTFDTAHHYGQSEAVLGRCLQPDGPEKIVTKTVKMGPGIGPDEVARTLDRSLAQLGRESVHAVLVHDPADLLGPRGDLLWGVLERFRAAGRANRIGVSVYEAAEIDRLLRSFPLEIVQLPWNPLDSRLVEGGQLERLHRQNVEIHARSLFLQGLLLQPPAAIPARFAPLREAVSELQEQARSGGLSPLEAVLALAWQRDEIGRFILGVTRPEELQAIILAAQKVEALRGVFRFKSSRQLDPVYLNPARWSELAIGGT